MEGDGRRECFRVNVDKWVCGVSRGSGEHRQLGQRSPRGTGKWGFYLPKHLREKEREWNKERGVEIERQRERAHIFVATYLFFEDTGQGLRSHSVQSHSSWPQRNLYMGL